MKILNKIKINHKSGLKINPNPTYLYLIFKWYTRNTFIFC